MASHRDLRLAQVAVAHGCPTVERALNIIASCRRHSLPVSVGFALFDHESDFLNVFGHDPVRSVPERLRGKRVTKARYLAYKVKRKLGLGMQGVGPGQLTWYATQDYADKKGGCWLPHINMDVAVETLAARIRDFGYVLGIERYNGNGPAAVRYSRELRTEASAWHGRFSRA